MNWTNKKYLAKRNKYNLYKNNAYIQLVKFPSERAKKKKENIYIHFQFLIKI